MTSEYDRTGTDRAPDNVLPLGRPGDVLTTTVKDSTLFFDLLLILNPLSSPLRTDGRVKGGLKRGNPSRPDPGPPENVFRVGR